MVIWNDLQWKTAEKMFGPAAVPQLKSNHCILCQDGVSCNEVLLMGAVNWKKETVVARCC
jgi:hypothetical protein